MRREILNVDILFGIGHVMASFLSATEAVGLWLKGTQSSRNWAPYHHHHTRLYTFPKSGRRTDPDFFFIPTASDHTKIMSTASILRLPHYLQAEQQYGNERRQGKMLFGISEKSSRRSWEESRFFLCPYSILWYAEISSSREFCLLCVTLWEKRLEVFHQKFEFPGLAWKQAGRCFILLNSPGPDWRRICLSFLSS